MGRTIVRGQIKSCGYITVCIADKRSQNGNIIPAGVSDGKHEKCSTLKENQTLSVPQSLMIDKLDKLFAIKLADTNYATRGMVIASSRLIGS
jgi:hypothetical protein